MMVALTGLKWLLIGLVLVGAVPLVLASYQFLLASAHFLRLHYGRCAPWFPRTAILVPAWNEAAVIGASVDRLMLLDYPPDALRIYVVDDASTDDTPEVIQAKAARYPGRVFHLRRQVGGEGKAHTLNHGLEVILRDDWMQAVLIMDADVIYEPSSLRKMTRHLADPCIGAVTAYIKEGSRPGNYLTRFIGYEYITAQAVARRAQNVLGVLACLAGGAQLHSRDNLMALGGQVDTSSLAEDTVTTFQTQRAGKRVIFEPHATVWAEEPGTIDALWKQRLRWARGNIQVSRRFWRLWFQPQAGNRLGGTTFGLLWFSQLLLPVVMVCATSSLVTLYFIDYKLAWAVFHVLWIANVICYAFITSFALLIDPQTGRHVWWEGLMFPGAVSLVIIVAAVIPQPLRWLAYHGASAAGFSVTSADVRGLELFTYIWLAGCMGVAYLAKVMQTRWLGRYVSPVLLFIGGFGPLLCAIMTAAYVKEIRGADARWEKTEKSGKVAMPV
jgi:cellulose synthase/poly-beta-1,6-N-acetylglucosamine synthase-like glycosyltransferase